MSKTLVRYNDPQEYRPQLLQRVYKTKLYSKELHCASQLKFYRYVSEYSIGPIGGHFRCTFS